MIGTTESMSVAYGLWIFVPLHIDTVESLFKSWNLVDMICLVQGSSQSKDVGLIASNEEGSPSQEFQIGGHGSRSGGPRVSEPHEFARVGANDAVLQDNVPLGGVGMVETPVLNLVVYELTVGGHIERREWQVRTSTTTGSSTSRLFSNRIGQFQESVPGSGDGGVASKVLL